MRRLSIALLVAVAVACGGPAPAPVPDVPPADPAVGVEQSPTGFVGQARDVASQVNDRTSLLDAP